MDALKNVFINWLCDAYKLEKKEEVYWLSKLEGCCNVTPIMPLVKDNLLGVEEHLLTLSKILVRYGAKEIPNKAIIELEPFEITERKYHISNDVIEKIILSYTIKQRKIAKYRILLRTSYQLNDRVAQEIFLHILHEENMQVAAICSCLDQLSSSYLKILSEPVQGISNGHHRAI